MTAKEKKAFAERMRKARAAKKRRKPVTRPAAKNSGQSRVKRRSQPARGKSRVTARNAAGASRKHRALARSSRKAGRVYGGRKRNPDLDAEEEMYRIFHGRAPERTIDHEELIQIRSKFAELGKLLELRFRLDGERTPMPLIDFGSCQAVCTADGKNIYFLGGNQTVDLAQLAIDSDKDYVELGECTYIKYFTRKGFHDFEPIDYYHEFGEEDGVRPVLAYDQLNRKLFLLGGNYRVEAPGIIN